MRKIPIIEEDADQRLDRFLGKLMKRTPQSLLHKWLRTGKIRVNGSRSAGNRRLESGDVLIFNLPDQILDESLSHPVAMNGVKIPSKRESDVSILHDDEAVLIVDKPAGLAVHAGTDIGDDHLTTRLLRILSRDRPSASLTYTPSPVHRLDRDTSGVIVFGKTASAHRLLAASLRERLWAKTYLGLVVGLCDPAEGLIDVPLARKDGKGNDSARTVYRTLWSNNGFSLLELSPETGRFRQIRRHCHEIGHPLIGDRRFPPPQSAVRTLNVDRLMLHAATLVFPHPLTGHLVTIQAPIPNDFATICKRAGLTSIERIKTAKK